MAVYLLHGVVDDWTAQKQTHFNYAPADRFQAHLNEKATPYATWDPNRPDADVLTIDDATSGGAVACMLARALGHHVIFFVNAFQVATAQPYVISVLDAVIDARTVSSVEYAEQTFTLTDMRGVRAFRTRVKQQLMAEDYERALSTVRHVSRLLASPDVGVPPHALPVSLGELRQLRDSGVQIENHGWSHLDIRTLSPSLLAQDLVRSREWLRDELSIDSRLYAVPFGLTDVPARCLSVIDEYFLADASRPLGRGDAKCWNRADLTCQLQSQPA